MGPPTPEEVPLCVGDGPPLLRPKVEALALVVVLLLWAMAGADAGANGLPARANASTLHATEQKRLLSCKPREHTSHAWLGVCDGRSCGRWFRNATRALLMLYDCIPYDHRPRPSVSASEGRREGDREVKRTRRGRSPFQ